MSRAPSQDTEYSIGGSNEILSNTRFAASQFYHKVSCCLDTKFPASIFQGTFVFEASETIKHALQVKCERYRTVGIPGYESVVTTQ